jgi:hypothetical protein
MCGSVNCDRFYLRTAPTTDRAFKIKNRAFGDAEG